MPAGIVARCGTTSILEAWGVDKEWAKVIGIIVGGTVALATLDPLGVIDVAGAVADACATVADTIDTAAQVVTVAVQVAPEIPAWIAEDTTDFIDALNGHSPHNAALPGDSFDDKPLIIPI